jgi:DeoR/GlpR family transcriptional regulator of sugar metabolism
MSSRTRAVAAAPSSGLSAPQRQAQLLTLLLQNHFLNVKQLGERLGVSTVTVRRDLADLASQGLLRRTHGGALVADQATADTAHEDRAVKRRAEKERIAQVAAQMVVEGDTVMIDAGTTCNAVARVLAARQNLTFVTNSLDVAAILGAAPGNRLFVVGGEFMPVNHAFAGPMAADMVRRFSVDKLFLSVSAIDLERGEVSMPSPQFACVQQAMIDVAKMAVVVADHSKFRRAALSMVCSLQRVHCIVTDGAADQRHNARVQALGSQLVRA